MVSLATLAVLLVTVWSNGYVSAKMHPVILIPGDGGSQLEAKLNKSTGPHYICSRHTTDFESLWLNIDELLPEVIDCFVDNMRLLYNSTTRKTSDNHGVHIRVKDFGTTASLEWLDPFLHVSTLSYFYPIVRDLVAIGYKRNISIRGAPFDFRRAPNEFGEYFKNLTRLVEETYTLNNETKVDLIAHSMGNPVTLYFLNHKPQVWKNKYIHSFITLAGVWGGAVKPLRLYSSGDDLGIVLVAHLKARKEQRSMPSTAFLMPSDEFWGPNEILVYTEKKNYTTANYKDFFTDIDFMDGYEMHLDTKDLIRGVKAPGVPVHCIHGTDVETPAGLMFSKGQFPDTTPKQLNGNGDGTVNMRSLLGCLKWVKKQKQPVKHYVIKGAEHMAILANPDTSKYIVDVVTGTK